MPGPAPLFQEAQRIHVRVPKNLADKLGDGTDRSRLVSTVLDDFFSKADGVDQVLKNLDLKERLEASKRMGATNFKELQAAVTELKKVRQEAANMKRSIFQSLRNATPEMRQKFLALYKRVKDQATEADESIALIRSSIRAMGGNP